MRVRLLLVGVLALCGWSSQAAQSTNPASQPVESELPAAVGAALAATTDFSFSYDTPGLLALLDHLIQSRTSPGHTAEPRIVQRWTDLLERPADFRGVPVTVSGTVGRNSSWRFQQPERQHLGTIHELQIRRDDQPITCKLVFTQDVSDISVGAGVTATGYFLTIQQYYSETKHLHHAAVLVGLGPTQVTQSAPVGSAGVDTSRLFGIVGALALGLLLAWFLLRRSAVRSVHSTRELRAGRPAPANLSDDLAAWAKDEEQLPP